MNCQALATVAVLEPKARFDIDAGLGLNQERK